MKTDKNLLKESFIKSLPIFFGYIFVGFSYGLMMEEAGFAWYYSWMTSVFVYTGAFQFVLITFLSSSASILTIVVTALLLNSRQIFYALTMLDDFKQMGKRLPYMIFSLTDETFAVNMTLKKEDPKRFSIMYFVAVFSRCYWIIGSVLGGVLGQLIPLNLEGIDFCMTALFIIIFVDQWENASSHKPALIGLASGVVCLAIFGQNTFFLPALLLASGLLLLITSRMNGKEANNERV